MTIPDLTRNDVGQNDVGRQVEGRNLTSAAVTAELIATSRELVLMAAEAVAEAQEMCARLAVHPGRERRPAGETTRVEKTPAALRR
jgi:hypothetical protein